MLYYSQLFAALSISEQSRAAYRKRAPTNHTCINTIRAPLHHHQSQLHHYIRALFHHHHHNCTNTIRVLFHQYNCTTTPYKETHPLTILKQHLIYIQIYQIYQHTKTAPTNPCHTNAIRTQLHQHHHSCTTTPYTEPHHPITILNLQVRAAKCQLL